MDRFAKALIKDYENNAELKEIEKIAFDRHISNTAMDIMGYGGKALGLAKNPIAAGAIGGAAIGGISGAATGQRGERGKRFKRGLIGGAIGGGTAGVLLGGGLKNLGRYGEGMAEEAKNLRKGGIRDVQKGEFAEFMQDKVYDSVARKGGKKVSDAVDKLNAVDEKIKNVAKGADKDAIKAMKKEYRGAIKAVNAEAGGLGGRFSAGESAAMAAGLAGAGGLGYNKYQQTKESSLQQRERISDAIDFLTKEANVFANLAGKAMQAGGAAVQNPGIAGAAIGAGVGAASAGEGNRLKGALVGGALGGGAVKGMQALAPTTAKNVQQFGTQLSAAGKKTVERAGKEGATFSGAVGKPLQTLKTTRGNFAKENIGDQVSRNIKFVDGKVVRGAKNYATEGMKGSTAAAIGTAGAVGAAGVGGLAFRD